MSDASVVCCANEEGQAWLVLVIHVFVHDKLGMCSGDWVVLHRNNLFGVTVTVTIVFEGGLNGGVDQFGQTGVASCCCSLLCSVVVFFVE